MRLTEKFKNTFIALLRNEEERKRKQFICIEILLCFISTFMSVLNVITQKNWLLLATLFMAVASGINILILFKSKKKLITAYIIFSLKVFVLFTYFIIFGGTEGFSTIWLLLIPACSLFAFGKKFGSILSATFFVELIVFFYTPLKDVFPGFCQDYTESFLERFPIIFAAFYLIGLFLESVREITHKEMIRLQQKTEYYALHDTLTGLYNRYGFNKIMDECIKNNDSSSKEFGLLIMDIDKFKDINDTHGHDTGDIILINLANRITEIIESKGSACRWGGEEFAVILPNTSQEECYKIAEALRESAMKCFRIGPVEIYSSISIGLSHSSEFNDVSAKDVTVTADSRLYDAKRLGRNRTVYKDS